MTATKKTPKKAPAKARPATKKSAAGKTAAPKFDPNMVVKLSEAAAVVGVTVNRLRQIEKDGDWFTIERGGKVILAEVVTGYVNFLKDEERRSSKGAAAARVTDARTREIELRTAMRLRTVVPVEDAQAIVDRIAAMVKAEFSGLPARHTRDLEVRRKLDAEIDAIFERLADQAAAQCAALEAGLLDMEADEAA